MTGYYEVSILDLRIALPSLAVRCSTVGFLVLMCGGANRNVALLKLRMFYKKGKHYDTIA